MIRTARREDASAAISLIYSTIGRIAHALAGTDNPREAILILEEFFQKRGNRLSYENTWVKDVHGKLAGVLVAYSGSLSCDLDEPFIERLNSLGLSNTITPEAEPDEFYLDTLAVLQEHEGQGFGTELLKTFEHEAIRWGYRKVGLLVERENERACRLYKKLGYQEQGQKMVSGYEFLHLGKVTGEV